MYASAPGGRIKVGFDEFDKSLLRLHVVPASSQTPKGRNCDKEQNYYQDMTCLDVVSHIQCDPRKVWFTL